MDQTSKVEHSIAAVPQLRKRQTHSRLRAAEGSDLAYPSQRLAVEQGFVHPIDFVVEQVPDPILELVVEGSDLAYPSQRLVVEQVPDPILELVVEGSDLAYPSQRLVVEQVPVDPILAVAAEHPRHWLVDLIGSRNLRLAYSPAGSSQEAKPVVAVPAVANQKRPQLWPASSSRYCETVKLQRLE
jgi:hypothetical protein